MKNMIKNYYRKSVPDTFQLRIDDLRKYITIYKKEGVKAFLCKWKNRQRRTCFGNDNSNKIFYIIRRDVSVEGLFSILNGVLGGLYRAELYGYIPVVDMLNYHSVLLQAKENRDKENAWEYFFEQPGGYSLELVKNSKNIVLSDLNFIEPRPNVHNSVEKMDIPKWSHIFKKYITVNSSIQNMVDCFYKQFDFGSRRVLGITIRRGIEWGYLTGDWAYKEYPKGLSFDEYLDLIDKKMSDWHCDTVFVSIDDEEGMQILKKRFGEKLLFIERARKRYFNNGLPLSIDEKNLYDHETYLTVSQTEITQRESLYLVETIILSKCCSLISTRTSANTTALIMNAGEYENILQID